MLIDLSFIEATVELLRTIVGRLGSVVGPSLLHRWFQEAAGKSWEQDADDYVKLKLLTTYVESRPQSLADPTELDYNADLATNA